MALKLATKFAKEFQRLLPQGNKFSGSDKNMFGNPNIGIRFDGVNENLSNSPFSRYGEKGIPDFLREVYFASSVLGNGRYFIVCQHRGRNKLIGKIYKTSGYSCK